MYNEYLDAISAARTARERPAHGYELKQALEQRFGAVLPPLNAGQIYTTLSRLERDGLVDDDAVAQNGRPNKRVYRLTEAGQDRSCAGGSRTRRRPRA